MMSLLEQKRGKIKEDHDRYSNLLCICQHWDDTGEIANFALLEVAANTNETNSHTATDETTTLGEFLQPQAWDCECQAALQTVGFRDSLFIYDHKGI